MREVGNELAIFTGATWSANFRGGAPAELVRAARTVNVSGELVRDPARVGGLLRAVLERGTPAREVGLSITPAPSRPTTKRQPYAGRRS